MATYKEIKGTQIEAVSSDPSNPVEGQVWYNTTSNVLKGQAVTSTGSWATGNNTNLARSAMPQATGTQTACIIYGGYGEPPPNNSYTGTESYNGTNWTEVNNLQNGRNSSAGCGTQTAAITAGGDPFPGVGTKTETWNGTNWTEVNTLNTSNKNQFMSGGSPAAVQYGGGPPVRANTELWNGTNWTEVNDQNQGRQTIAGAGISTAALAFGGNNAGTTDYALTETWNGTNWTEVNDLNTAREKIAGQGASNTDCMAAGGVLNAPNTAQAKTEIWNGTNWTEDGDLNTARSHSAGGGTTSAAVIANGSTDPGLSQLTEEWTGAGDPQTRTFTDS